MLVCGLPTMNVHSRAGKQQSGTMPKVFQIPQFEQHFAPITSCAGFCCVLSPIIILVVSWAIAYGTHSLWITQATYQEQALVEFMHEYMFEAESSNGQRFVHTTFENYNAMLFDDARVVSFQSAPIYTNIDEKPDMYKVLVTVPLAEGETVNSVKCAAFFRYHLDGKTRVRMNSAAYLTYSSPVPGKRLTVDGDLVFKQRTPLPFKGSNYEYDVDIVSPYGMSLSQYSWSTWIPNYDSRNLTTTYQYDHPVWEAKSGDNSFVLDMTIRIPTQDVVYKPGFWETFKFGWIQIFNMGFLVYLVTRAIQKFMFLNQLAPTKIKRQGRYVPTF